jgi:TIR domain
MMPRVNLNLDRWTVLYPDEERLLLRLAAQRGPIGDTALGVITHLPLRPKARGQMRACLKQRLQNSVSEEQHSFLRKLDRWVRESPHELAGEDYGRPVRDSLDAKWIYSPAPGFSSFTDADRSIARRRAERELTALAEQVRAASYSSRAAILLDPIVVTLLFEFAGREAYYDVWLGNAIVRNIAEISAEFRPDAAGLFAEYFSAAERWSSFVGKDLGPWYLDERDNEINQCWRSWQIAWVVSRGGLGGLVTALVPWLGSAKSSEQITALALLSDVADYVVQAEPECFGGGRLPPRMHPDDPAYTLADAPVRLGISAPREVRLETPFVARLVAYTSGEEERAESLLRGSRGRSEPALDQGRCRWPVGTQVVVAVSGDHVHIDPASRNFVWAGETITAVFDVKVLDRVPEIVIRFDVGANGFPTANLRLEVAVTAEGTSSWVHSAAQANEQLQVRQGRAALSAFASYARPDRERVLDGVETMRSIGIDVFTDCLDLHPGEEWKERLAAELNKRELFVLFWSRAARRSRWVSWELDTVLVKRGKECICVTPLEPDVMPPESLGHLHFSSVGAWVRAGIAAVGRQRPHMS